MTVISYICFSVCALVIVSMLGRRNDPFSPGRIFLLIWLGGIGLADFKFSLYQSEWSLYAWVVMAIGISAFMLGLFVCYVLFLPRRGLTIAEIRSVIQGTYFNKRKAFAVITGLFIAYLVSYALEVAVMGYIPIFMFKADRARVEFGLFGVHLIVTSMPTILFLIVQYFILVKGERLKKWALTSMFLVTMGTFFLLLVRFLFVPWALMSLAYFYYASHRFKFRWIGLATVAFYSMLQYLLSFRVAIYVKNFVYVVSRMKYSEEYAAFTEPYMYIVMNFENFARGIEKLDTHSYGYFTADPLLALTGLKHGMADYFSLTTNTHLVSSFNTWPFMWQYYLDFGILGVTVIPFAIAMCIGVAYYRLKESPTPVNVIVYVISFFVIVISFFTNPLTMLSLVFNIAMLILIQIWLATPNANTRTIAGS